MLARTRFTWEVRVGDKEGATAVEGVTAYWSPDHELTRESVAQAACCQAKARTGRTHLAVTEPKLIA
jgi:hypothetical protein